MVASSVERFATRAKFRRDARWDVHKNSCEYTANIDFPRHKMAEFGILSYVVWTSKIIGIFAVLL